MNFLKKVFSPTIFTISLLLLIYTLYRSEIYWDGKNRNYYLIYYLVSLLLIFFSIITFFINQKIKEYIIISGISLVVSLYLFEGYLTFKDNFSKERLYEKQTGKKWDKRTRIEIYEDLKKTNNEVTITVHPSYYLNRETDIFPLSGISNSQTIHCNESGYYSIYESDRHGFNNPDEEWDSKNIRYLLVGDSFTHGACVNRPNDIASVLRKLSKKSVLNLGMSGNGPILEFAILKKYLNSNVKKVLWMYFEGNDINELIVEKKNNILINYLNDLTFTQNDKLIQNEINNLITNSIYIEKKKMKRKIEIEKREKNFKSRLIRFIKINNIRILIQFLATPKPAPVIPPEFKKIVEMSKELVEKNNSKLYFVYLPEYRRFNTDYDNTNYNLVKNIVKELNIPFIDTIKLVFEKQENPLKLFPFEQEGHYNVEGYKKVADAIFNNTDIKDLK